jgi:hypothetical protein
MRREDTACTSEIQIVALCQDSASYIAIQITMLLASASRPVHTLYILSVLTTFALRASLD